MKRIYLHIGFHKTGTTSIQNFLFSNSEYLLSRGYLYPQSGKDESIGNGHHLIPWKLMDKASGFEWSDLLLEIEKSEANSIIISSEEFEFCLKASKNIAKMFSDFCVKIIVYLRRQDNYIDSNYNQCVKQGSFTGSIQEFASLMLKGSSLDYYKICCQLSKVFGEENLIVRNYEKQKKDLMKDFLSVIGLAESLSDDNQGLNWLKNANTSVDVRLIPALRVLGKMRDKIGESKFKEVRNKLLKKSREYPQEEIRSYILPLDLRREIMNDFSASNQKLLRFIDDISGLIYEEDEFSEKQILNVDLISLEVALDLVSCFTQE